MSITVTYLSPVYDTGSTGGTTGSYNTSGYDGIALCIASYTNTSWTVTDNKNAFSGSKFGFGTRDTSQSGSSSSAQIVFSWDKTLFGTGHTFTISGTVVYPSLFVIGLTGTMSTASPKSVSSATNTGATANPTSVASSLTPLDNDCLLLSIITAGTSDGVTNLVVSSGGFTKLAGFTYHNANGLGAAVASLVQSGAPSAATCTWGILDSAGVGAAASIIALKPIAVATASLFRKSNLNGVGAGGPFFTDPLGTKGFSKRNHIYVPNQYMQQTTYSHLSI